MLFVKPDERIVKNDKRLFGFEGLIGKSKP